MYKPMYWFLIIIVIVIVGVSAWWWRGRSAAPKLAALTVGAHSLAVEVADTFPLRERGLSGREKLEENRGMLFVFSTAGNHAFWMKGMQFPLDFVWIRERKVIGTTENVPQPTGSLLSLPIYYPPSEADAMLEVAAGTVARLGIREGDVIELKE